MSYLYLLLCVLRDKFFFALSLVHDSTNHIITIWGLCIEAKLYYNINRLDPQQYEGRSILTSSLHRIQQSFKQ